MQWRLMMERLQKSRQRKTRNMNIKNMPRLPSLLKHSLWKSGPSRSAALKLFLLETALWKPTGKVHGRPYKTQSWFLLGVWVLPWTNQWWSQQRHLRGQRFLRENLDWRVKGRILCENHSYKHSGSQNTVLPLSLSRARPPEHHLPVQTRVQSQTINAWCQKGPPSVLRSS